MGKALKNMSGDPHRWTRGLSHPFWMIKCLEENWTTTWTNGLLDTFKEQLANHKSLTYLQTKYVLFILTYIMYTPVYNLYISFVYIREIYPRWTLWATKNCQNAGCSTYAFLRCGRWFPEFLAHRAPGCFTGPLATNFFMRSTLSLTEMGVSKNRGYPKMDGL